MDDALSIADLAVVSNLVMFQYLGNRLDGHLAAYFARHRYSAAIGEALDAERPFVEGVAGLDPKI